MGFRSFAGTWQLAQPPGSQHGREVPDDHCHSINCARHDPAAFTDAERLALAGFLAGYRGAMARHWMRCATSCVLQPCAGIARPRHGLSGACPDDAGQGSALQVPREDELAVLAIGPNALSSEGLQLGLT